MSTGIGLWPKRRKPLLSFTLTPTEVVEITDGVYLTVEEVTCAHCGSSDLDSRYMEEEAREIPWCGRCKGRAD